MRILISLVILLATCRTTSAQPAPDAPRSLDPRLEIVQFAASPDIVHPIAVDFDAKGRLLVVESHTHFRPAGYKGPATDRIRILEDTDGDGKADKFTTFYEGTKATMDLAVHFDGSVYVATRNEILRLRDTKGTGKADEVTRLMFLKTDGNYPHNGLSGLCFDAKGDLYFGLGENLGAKYTLIGADGKEHAGGGEGGGIFWCSKDGKGLRRVATGFWNPFGVCRDVYGRMFAVDNDADSRPPCRLVHVVEGGDYGYQFRYGRSGRHPFQAWNGELPGTLPYVAGVGEAPCEVLAYESDGLPKDYLGTLLVTSWADHQLECYPLEAKGASFTAKKKVVIQGGQNFRPVGLAVAPDGSLFMSDWVRRDYNLHGQGAVWQVRMKERKAVERPKEAEKAILSLDRRTREAAARTLAESQQGMKKLREHLIHSDPRVVATAFHTRAASPAPKEEGLSDGNIIQFNEKENADIRAMAAPSSFSYFFDWRNFPWDHQIQFHVIPYSDVALRRTLDVTDPFIRHQVVRSLSHDLTPERKKSPLVTDPGPVRRAIAAGEEESKGTLGRGQKGADFRQVSFFLACRLADTAEDRAIIPKLLDSRLDDIRFLTAKWIADDVIREARPALEKAMKDPNVNSRLYFAYGTALARLDGNPVDEIRLADIFLKRAQDDKAPAAARVFSLRMVPTSWGGLQTDQLVKWLGDESGEMRLEAVRALAQQTTPKRSAALLALVKDQAADPLLRREALTGLADQADKHVDLFLALAEDAKAPLAADALRGLVNVPLPDADKSRLETLAKSDAALQPLVDRVLGRPLRTKEAQSADVDAWLKRLDGPADAAAGRRAFFHPRLAGCFRCHRVDGRGQDIGPDLSTIGQRERRFILDSILFPSREVAPHFQTWQVETSDGKVRNGLLSRTDLDQTSYIDEKGKSFTVKVGDIVEARPVPASIMPEGLVAQFTDQELRDLLAYLASRK